ncbi:hypothetical protein GCK32_000632 [Trichostrongylus colubriformis]|uniref:Uncharacterized protein n=1 Tax=Trichostrongylus colubriformis TaxID=6319 RepID=A0AAN8FIW1_TRICO
MRVGFILLSTCMIHIHGLWLPFENFEAILQAIREATTYDASDKNAAPVSFERLVSAGKQFFSDFGRLISRTFNEDERRAIANGIREFFNVSTAPGPRITVPYTTPTTASPRRTAVTAPNVQTSTLRMASSTTRSSPKVFTTYSPVFIWPTSVKSTTPPVITRKPYTWRPVVPNYERSTSEPVENIYSRTSDMTPAIIDNIPFHVKAMKLARPFPPSEHLPTTAHGQANAARSVCQPGERCEVHLESFDTTDPVFQYAYSHSTIIDEYLQGLLREMHKTSFPATLSWRDSVTPEVLQLTQSLMSLYKPSRCLVIGVFTGFALLGIAEQVDYRGVIIALEHPKYAHFWEDIGLKYAKKMPHAQMSRIHVRSAEPIDRSLSNLAANEPNTFDFIFLDDFERGNYMDDYEHAVRLLRNGGLLIINKALNKAGVLSGVELMSDDDRAISSMNSRIKHDARVRASLLPYGGGAWIIIKK